MKVAQSTRIIYVLHLLSYVTTYSRSKCFLSRGLQLLIALDRGPVLKLDRHLVVILPANTMMTSSNGIFSALLAICAGIHRSPVNSPHQGQWRGALMFSLICIWINGWVSNREAGDLRRYRPHYDVIVMYLQIPLYPTVTGHRQAHCWLQDYIFWGSIGFEYVFQLPVRYQYLNQWWILVNWKLGNKLREILFKIQ